MVDCLGDALPARWPQSLAILRRALPEPLDPTLTDDDFGQFIHAGNKISKSCRVTSDHRCVARRIDGFSTVEKKSWFLRAATFELNEGTAGQPPDADAGPCITPYRRIAVDTRVDDNISRVRRIELQA